MPTLKELLPTPVGVNFGEGRIKMQGYKDGESYGIFFSEVAEPHPINFRTKEILGPHMPEAGEIYFSFSNLESMQALRDQVDEMIEIKKSYQFKKDDQEY